MRDLIFIHGALGDSSQLKQFADLFAGSFRVHVLNLKGHGSDAAVDFTMEGFVEQVRDFMRRSSISDAYFFGYSMGGYVALSLASSDPERVLAVVTLGTKLHWSPEVADKETAMLDPVKMIEKVPEFAHKLKLLHTGSGWEKVLRMTASLMRQLGESPLTNDDFAGISCRVLLLRGSKDRMVSDEETKHAAELIPDASYMVLDQMPHPFEMVDHKVLYPVVSSFLASQE